MIRMATIGTSAITGSLLDALTKVEGVTFAGTLSRDAERAAAFTAKHHGTRPPPRSMNSPAAPMSTPSTSAARMRCTVRRRSRASPAASTYSSKSPSAPTRVRRTRSSRRPRRRVSSHSRPCALCTTPPSTRSKNAITGSALFAARPCAWQIPYRGTTEYSGAPHQHLRLRHGVGLAPWTSASVPVEPSSSYSERPAHLLPQHFSTSRRRAHRRRPRRDRTIIRVASYRECRRHLHHSKIDQRP